MSLALVSDPFSGMKELYHRGSVAGHGCAVRVLREPQDEWGLTQGTNARDERWGRKGRTGGDGTAGDERPGRMGAGHRTGGGCKGIEAGLRRGLSANRGRGFSNPTDNRGGRTRRTVELLIGGPQVAAKGFCQSKVMSVVSGALSELSC